MFIKFLYFTIEFIQDYYRDKQKNHVSESGHMFDKSCCSCMNYVDSQGVQTILSVSY